MSADSHPFAKFKLACEEKWSRSVVRGELWGFQIRPGTRWNPGLTESEIADFESAVGASFPPDFRSFLREMNGTDMPTIDIRGNSGERPRLGLGFYAYPRDIEAVQELMKSSDVDPTQLRATLAEEGIDLPDAARLVPIYAHRFVTCVPGSKTSMVLSIWDPSDAVLYGRTLEEYLYKEVGLE